MKTAIPKRYINPNVHSSIIYKAKTWEQPKCPSTNEWIKKIVYICICIHKHTHTHTHKHTHKMKYYLAMKKNKILSFASIFLDLEIIILSEGSQIEEDILYYITYTWNLK